MSPDKKGRPVSRAKRAAASARGRPPALGRWLLRLGLPRGLLAEAIAGDLEQEYRRLPAPGRLWYLRQAAGIVWRSTRDRLRGLSWSEGSGSATTTGTGDPPEPGRRRERRRARRRLEPRRIGETVLQDTRFALRTLAQRPIFTAVAIGTLAIGIGIDVAIFSVVNALLLRPIPAVFDPSSLVEVYSGDDNGFVEVPYGAFEILRDEAASLDDLAGWRGMTVAFRDVGGEDPFVLRGFEVTGNYFRVLGVEPALGRFFAPHESYYPNVADAVVISYDLWQRRYTGGSDVLGRQVSINGYPTRIIGVAPQGFAGHQILVQRDVFVPFGLPAPGLPGPQQLEAPTSGDLVLLGRLVDGASLEAARQELRALADRFWTDSGVEQADPLRVEPYGAVPSTDRSAVALFFAMLMIIVAIVLAIACVNVANMLLSRAAARRREFAIRMSLGAGRGRMVQQLLTESTLMFLIAGVAGLLLTVWTTGVLVAVYLPSMASTRLHLDVSPDARVFAFTFGIAALTGLVFGLAPALGATRSAAVTAVRSAAGHMRRSRLRGLLVGGQMALALVLLIAAGLMVRALSALDSVDLGFDVDGVYAVELRLQLVGYDAERSRVFYTELLDELRNIPGIAAAATARRLPMATRSPIAGIYPDGIAPLGEQGFSADFNRVSADYFRTTGMTLLAGREFDAFDDEDAPPVAVINATMARRVWSEESAVGKHFTIGRGEEATRYEVVGVATDAHHHGFGQEVSNYLYLASAQSPDARAYVLIRADDLAGTIGPVRAAVSGLDADVPLVEVTPMRDVLAGFAMGQRLAAWVAGVVGAVGLLLGAVGVYGVTAFAVTQRTHEIGVRMALGARAADVRSLMLRTCLRAPVAGMLTGLLIASAAAQVIGSFLYEVSPLDPWTYSTVIVVLGIVAAGATLIPARRAAAMNPVETLRSD